MESSTNPSAAETVSAPAAPPATSSQMPKNLGIVLLVLLVALPLILAFVQLMRRQQQGDAVEVPLTPLPVEDTPVAGDGEMA